MENYTPLKKLNNRKKINKFLVTGNLLLAFLIAVTGFIYYNNTLQTTQQKAGFDCSDWSDKRKCAEERKEYEESGQADADKEAKKKKEQEERRLEREEIGGGSCPGGYVTCEVTDTGGRGHRFCLDETKNTGCNNEAVDRGITVKTGIGVGSGLAEQGGWICEFGKKGYSGGPCLQNNSVKTIGNQKPPACFCGIIQIDGGEYDGTYQSTCGCGSKEEEQQITTMVVGTIVPTPTGGIPTSTPTPTISTVTEIPTPTMTPAPTNTPTQTPTPAPGTPTATPTEIIIAKTTISPTAVAKLLETGVVKSFIYLVPAAIMLIGLIL